MSYKGQIIELPLGDKGLTGTKSLAKTDPGQLLQALNVSYEDGTVSKEGGASRFNENNTFTGSQNIQGGWGWSPNASIQYSVILLDGGAVLVATGDGVYANNPLIMSAPTTGVPSFVEGGSETLASPRKLFIFSPGSQVGVLSGTTPTGSYLATPPADWSGANQPVSGTIHENRLWGALGHRVYASLPGNHEDFVSAGAVNLLVYPGMGEYIVQIMSWKSLLLIWKYPRGIYAIDTSSITTSDWRTAKINESMGGVSPLGACQIDDDVLFVDSAYNVQLLSGIQEYGKVGNKNLSQFSELGAFIRENLSFSGLINIRTVYYPAKREVHIACAQLGSSVNNARLVVDFNNPALPRFRYSTRDVCQSIWLAKDSSGTQRLTSGDDAGVVWTMDTSARSKNGLAYTGSFQTAYTDMSNIDPSYATKRKIGDFLEIVGQPSGDWDLSAVILWDGKIAQTVAFDLNPTGVSLGTFVLGTDTLGDSTSLSARTKRIVGSGRRFSAIFYNSGVGESFSISRAYLSFRVGDERVST